MRELKRNKSVVYYANYEGEEDIVDDDGYFTSETKPSYSKPKELEINVSPASGEFATRQFNKTVDYDRTLCICGEQPIKENSVLWVEQDINKPHNYIVKKVAKSLNSTIIAIKSVEVS